jgi:hypothetical protein
VFELECGHPAGRETLSVGPASHFTVRGHRLLAGSEDHEVGFYQDGLWHVGNHSFTAIKARCPIILCFHDKDASAAVQTLGPFEHVGLVDGAIRHGPKLGRLLAKYDDATQTWLVYRNHHRCGTIVLRPAQEQPPN